MTKGDLRRSPRLQNNPKLKIHLAGVIKPIHHHLKIPVSIDLWQKQINVSDTVDDMLSMTNLHTVAHLDVDIEWFMKYLKNDFHKIPLSKIIAELGRRPKSKTRDVWLSSINRHKNHNKPIDWEKIASEVIMVIYH